MYNQVISEFKCWISLILYLCIFHFSPVLLLSSTLQPDLSLMYSILFLLSHLPFKLLLRFSFLIIYHFPVLIVASFIASFSILSSSSSSCLFLTLLFNVNIFALFLFSPFLKPQSLLLSISSYNPSLSLFSLMFLKISPVYQVLYSA